VPVRIHTFTGQVWATKHGVGRVALRRLDTLVARLATVTLADSLSQRDFLVREGVATASQLVVLGKGSVKGVDPAVFRPDPARRDSVRRHLQIGASEVLVLFVGRLTHDKGVLDLARAFARVADERPNLRLLIVGPDEERLQPAIAAACGRHVTRVQFLAFTDRPQDLMVAADVLCLPSYREGVGTVTIEAGACGVPVIASRIYGITDAVMDGRSALLHAPGDVEGLASLLDRLITDPQLRRSLGAAGREHAVREFHVDRITALQLALYATVLQGADQQRVSLAQPVDSSVPTPAQACASWYRRGGKRLLDVTGAAVMLVVLAPVIGVVALLVRLTLGAPVLFTQRRPGLNAQPFTLLKFRTMTDRHDSHGRPLPDADRMTAVGRFLRATSLDELPQLWNVLAGDMSLVGPRPLLSDYLPRYSARQARRHCVKPGLTGLAQVNGRNELPWPERLELDVAYVETFSAASDASILARTVWQVLARRGITQAGQATVGEFRGAEGR
jgi:lipopolysaccharide/colanic/teichoic acid biosynthesis glycosyltransferase